MVACECYIDPIKTKADRLQTSEGGLKIFLMHINIFNFAERWGKLYISRDYTIWTFLPLKFDVVDQHRYTRTLHTCARIRNSWEIFKEPQALPSCHETTPRSCLTGR